MPKFMEQLATLSLLLSLNWATRRSAQADNYDLENGNAAIEVVIQTVAPVIFTDVSPSGGNATLVVPVTKMGTSVAGGARGDLRHLKHPKPWPFPTKLKEGSPIPPRYSCAVSGRFTRTIPSEKPSFPRHFRSNRQTDSQPPENTDPRVSVFRGIEIVGAN